MSSDLRTELMRRRAAVRTRDVGAVDAAGARFYAFVLDPFVDRVTLQLLDARVEYDACNPRRIVAAKPQRREPPRPVGRHAQLAFELGLIPARGVRS